MIVGVGVSVSLFAFFAHPLLVIVSRTRGISRKASDKKGLDELFEMLPELPGVNFKCIVPTPEGIVAHTHIHDKWVCVKQKNVKSENLYSTNLDGYKVPCTTMLHEYAHVLDDATEAKHAHGEKWQGILKELYIRFDIPYPSEFNIGTGEWGGMGSMRIKIGGAYALLTDPTISVSMTDEKE